MPLLHNHNHAPPGANLAPEMSSALANHNKRVFTGPGEIPRKITHRHRCGIDDAM